MPRTRWLFPFASAAVALLVAASPATPRPAIAFQHRAGLLVVSAPGYRLALSDRNGRLVTLRERGDVLVDGGRCLWGMLGESDTSYVGGCSFARTGTHRFSYRWDARRSRLTLTYSGQSFGSSVVTVLAHAHALDLQMTLANRGRLRSRIRFPDGLGIRAADVVAGYAPNVLPGVRLAPGFFSRVGTDVQIYPSRWAFADYLALDERGGSVALYTVAPARPHPAAVGFFHAAAPSLCSGPTACVLHEFETWV